MGKLNSGICPSIEDTALVIRVSIGITFIDNWEGLEFGTGDRTRTTDSPGLSGLLNMLIAEISLISQFLLLDYKVPYFLFFIIRHSFHLYRTF